MLAGLMEHYLKFVMILCNFLNYCKFIRIFKAKNVGNYNIKWFYRRNASWFGDWILLILMHIQFIFFKLLLFAMVVRFLDIYLELFSIYSTAQKVSVFGGFWFVFLCIRTRKTPNTDTFHAVTFHTFSFWERASLPWS